MSLRLLALAGLLVAWVQPGQAQNAREEPVDPHRFVSASGQYALSVDSVERFGQGSADCRLERDGRAVWSARLPFTLRDVVVAADGTAAGYAYSAGLQGMSADSRQMNGTLRLVILDAKNGHPRLDESIARRPTGVLHAPPAPTAAGVLLDETHGAVAMRLCGSDSSGETWRIYRLADGRKVRAFDPLPSGKTDELRSIESARNLAGTSLALVQWIKSNPFNDEDAHFALVNLDDGTQVWSVDFPADYRPANPDDSPYDRMNGLLQGRKGLAILETGANSFALWSAARQQRIAYTISGAGPPWTVAEKERTALASPAPDPAEAPPGPRLPMPIRPDKPLKPTHVFRFPADAPPPSAIRAIGRFSFDGKGLIGFERREAARTAFVLIDPSHGGEVRREIDLTALDLAKCSIGLSWLEGERWILIAWSDRNDKPPQSRAWTLDAHTGEVVALSAFDCPGVTSIAGSGNGRFVVLAAKLIRHSPEDSLICFDGDGRPVWTVPGSYDTLFSPEDVTVLGDGKTVAVVETIGNHVRLFRLADGTLERSIDLQKTWGREPTYPSEITPDGADGYIIGDWQNKGAPYVRTDRDGKPRGVIHPRLEDGRAINAFHMPMRTDPSGQLWATDGESLLRLDKKGRVNLALGAPRDPQELGAVGGLTVSDAGRLYAADARTDSVSIFDDAGRRLGLGENRPKDVPADAERFDLAVAPDGSFLLGPGEFSGATFPPIQFSAVGKRLRVMPKSLAGSTGSLRFMPDGKQVAAGGWGEARLIDAKSGQTTRKIERQFGGQWLDEFVQGPYPSPDGSFIVATDFQQNGEWNVNFYASDSAPTRLLRMPYEANAFFFAYDGREIVTAQKESGRLLVFDAAGRAPTRGYTPGLPGGGALNDDWAPFFAHGGQELWLVCAETKTVARFAWPLEP